MCHPWLAAGTTCFVAALLVRELAPLTRGPAPHEARWQSGLLGIQLRTWFRRRIAPVVDVLLRFGLTANAVTLFQLATSIVCGLAYAAGWMFTAGWILITSGTLDVLDGEMARRKGHAGPRGAFIDSVVDRYGESAVFAGLVAFYRDSWILWGVLAAWAGGFLVSYTRARAESLGIDCREGLLQRPERYVILGISSMVSVVVSHLACHSSERHGLLGASVVILALLANATALQRARSALRRLA
jgi:CDP-diacylglycerol--glycerol-3-phosphate 3-phosphatidyltransferase